MGWFQTLGQESQKQPRCTPTAFRLQRCSTYSQQRPSEVAGVPMQQRFHCPVAQPHCCEYCHACLESGPSDTAMCQFTPTSSSMTSTVSTLDCWMPTAHFGASEAFVLLRHLSEQFVFPALSQSHTVCGIYLAPKFAYMQTFFCMLLWLRYDDIAFSPIVVHQLGQFISLVNEESIACLSCLKYRIIYLRNAAQACQVVLFR